VRDGANPTALGRFAVARNARKYPVSFIVDFIFPLPEEDKQKKLGCNP